MAGNSTEFLKNTFETGEKQARPRELSSVNWDQPPLDPTKPGLDPEAYHPGPGNAATAGGALAGPSNDAEAAVNFGVKDMAPEADSHTPPADDQARGDGKVSLSRLADE